MKTRLLVLLATLLLAACATMLGPRQVEVPLSTLEQALANRFPFNNRYLELLDISISNPRLSLQPGTNRVLTHLDANIAPPFLNTPLRGNFTVSGSIRFDPARSALVLAEPRVETFNVDGLDTRLASQMTKVGRLLAEEALKDLPLYTLNPNDLRHAGTRYTLSKITTKPNSLVVTFEPLK